MISKDVAIIGMAARLPEADTLDAFLSNLRAGRDSIRELSDDRRARTSLLPNEAYQLCAYIDDIDTFDHAFFNISKGEAKTMAPQHRMLLQVAYQALENAGYDPASLRGSRTAVYLADTRIAYHLLAQTQEPTLVMGSHVSAMAGRIARFFDLRGPAAMIDTACSSSLVALHFAMNDLLLGEADLALVGCASLDIFPSPLTEVFDIGIRSPDGKTRCFSAEAAGTGSGEAVVAIVLKRFDAAQRDGDLVHSVVKSVAVNQVGGRASTLTAPDAHAEAEVMRMAWEKAGIDPETVSYIEAHGTATRLGDPIEIEGIDMAFSRVSTRKQFCALSSVKSNIGHTWSAAGLVGVVKATLALRHHELFPNVHCANLSPLIDFARSAVTVTQELTPWAPACGVRRAGVSSYGLMGTNAHAILEEGPPPSASSHAPHDSERGYWIPVSARSTESLAANLAALRDWLRARPALRPIDLQKTLVGGRGHFEHRFAVAVADLAELDRALAEPTRHQGRIQAANAETVVALIFSGQCHTSAALTGALRAAHPAFDRLYAECERAGAECPPARIAEFAFQYAFHGWLRELGFKFEHLIGEGAGRYVTAAIGGRVSLPEAIRQSCHVAPDPVPLRARVERLLSGLADQRIVFVEAGPLAAVTKLLLELRAGEVVALDDHAHAVPRLLADLYRAGATWTFASCAGDGRRTELPSYQFQKIRCWLNEISAPTSAPTGVRTDAPVPRKDARDAGAADAALDTLTVVRQIWSEILGVDDVSPDATFFALGGDSIAGLRSVARINAMLGVNLDDFAIYDDMTLSDLVARIDALRVPAPTEAQPPTSPPAEPEFFPATPAQEQVWLAAQFEGGSVAFNLTRSFKLTGHIDPARLQRAVNALVARNEALRATFRMVGDALMQRVTPLTECVVAVEVVQHEGPSDEVALGDAVRRFAALPFDLDRGPLVRVQLRQLGRDTQVLTLVTHHIVADGWSLGLLVRDLGALVANDRADLPPIAVRYREQVVADGDGPAGAAGSADYWLGLYADVPSLIDLPLRTKKGSAAFQGAYLKRQFPEALSGQLKKFSREQGGTHFAALLTLFAAYLARHTDDGRMVLGTSIVERGNQAAEQLVGMLVRTIPLRLAVSQEASLNDLYGAVRATFGEALRHRAYPYEQLIKELRLRNRLQTPHLFNVLIEYEQFGEVDASADAFLEGTGIAATPLDVNLDTSVFPLNIMLSEQPDGFNAVFRFDTSLLEQNEIERLWRNFVELATVLLQTPAQPMGALPLLTDAEARRIRALGHRSLPFDPTRLVHRELERHAAVRPNEVCLSSPDGASTFAELNRRANRLARHFRDRHAVRPGDLVALVMDRSRLLVESILALWKCGAAYLPIDPAYPPAFIAQILGSARVATALYDPCQLGRAAAEQLRQEGRHLVPLTPESGAEESADNIDTPVAPDQLAYVIYTSGSTGVPKGAMIEHRGMLNHLHAKIADLQLSDRSVVAHNAPSSFDISVWQMFAGPFVGGRTVIYPQAVQMDPRGFAEQLQRAAVTVLEVVPSYLSPMLDVWEQMEVQPMLAALEYLLVTGEEVQPRVVNRWLERYPTVPVVNAYGPTEASDDITHHVITQPVMSGSVPVGRPIPNTFIYLLDALRRVVPEGSVGDIYVSGICVGRGYLHDPEQTARVFTPDPFEPEQRMYRTGDRGRWTTEGALEFLGRTDHQVKVRGFRLDVGEIERRLGECPGVKAATITPTPGAKDQLSAYVVLERGASVEACRSFLSQRLPHYMVPATFVELAKLPLTPNGKVDRKALAKIAPPPADAAAAPAEGADGETLATLSGIWAEVLGRTDIRPEDGFFDVGGNSLRAIQVLSRIRSRLMVDLPLEVLFVQPNLAALTAEVMRRRPAEIEAIPTVAGTGTFPVAPTQELLLQVDRDYEERAAFNRNDLYRVHGRLDVDLLAKAFADVIERHESLRTTFGYESGAPVQIVHAPGELPLPLKLEDFTGAKEPSEAARHFVERRIRTPFAIRREALVRADLLKTSSDTFLLLVSMHQLISDGRSAEVFVDDWLTRYLDLAQGRPAAVPPLPVQAKDVASWRRRLLTPQQKSRHRAFWRSRLEGASSLISLPTDLERPRIATLNGVRLRVDVPDSWTSRLAALASELGITEFVVAHVAVSLMLLACTGGTDVTIGTYARGRERLELENQIGLYINTMPLRLRLGPEDEVRPLLVRAQKELLEAFEHQTYPYGWTMEDLGWRRGLERSPIFDVMIAFDDLDDDMKKRQDPGAALRFESLDLPRRSKEGDLLIVFMRTKGRLELMMTYNTDVFSPELARRYADRLVETLTDVLEARSLAEILARGKVT
ncbi:amino acid adenylation domain-containing protein [Sorangium sp. So ce1335]|uniref:amino acid adenylation domain-containing protein n=1 Tax=Sorangium sp. So ce1335 TaxID=3133335 RepID=UPI003F631FC9